MIDGIYSCCMFQDMNGSPIRRYGQLTLRSDGTRLSGRMFPTMFWLDSPFSHGNTDGENITFTVHFATPCQQYAAEVTGKVVNNTLTATVHTPMGDYRLDGTKN